MRRETRTDECVAFDEGGGRFLEIFRARPGRTLDPKPQNESEIRSGIATENNRYYYDDYTGTNEASGGEAKQKDYKKK